MNNRPSDATSLHRGRVPAPTDTSATTGVSINIESDNDGDDNESTSAEHDYLLPASMPPPPLTMVTSTQPIVAPNANTSINMESANQPARSSSLTGSRPSGGNILSSLLARQRSFTPVNTSPVRVTTQMNRRLQQSRSVGANSGTIEEPSAPATVTSPASMRQLGFWRVNLNDVLSLSTAPSTEALRSFVNHSHSNFRHYPPATLATTAGNAGSTAGNAGSTAVGQNVSGVTASADNTHIQLNPQQLPPNETEAPLPLSTSVTRSPCMGAFQNSGGMGRSISLREGEMQRQARHSLNGRHNASVIGLTTPAVSSAAIINPPPYETTHSEGAGDGGAPEVLPSLPHGIVPPQPLDINADDDQLITETVVQILSHFVRYVPILCILFIKFVHDHLVGILDLLLLQTIMYTLNRSVRHQVSRLAQRNYAVLFRDACVIIVVVALRLFMSSMPPDPLGLLVPPPKIYQTIDVSTSHYKTDGDLNNVMFASSPTTFHSSFETLKDASNETVVPKVIPLGMLLYYVAISDLLLKLLTILAKIGVTLLPLHMIRLKVRARLYVLVEFISQFYRALVPMSQWFMFLYESYSGLEVISGGLFSSLYIGAKIFELLERGKSLKKAITTFRRNIDSERPPTKDELDAASSVCPICHDVYNSPILLECGHIFCDECVQTWFKREQTCPMCRAKVSDDPAWQDGSTTFFHQLY